MRTSERRRDRGFSLPVFLVGIVIVGLVATVIVIGLVKGDKPPSTAACEADRAAMLRAEQEFHTEHRQYGTEVDLVTAGLLDDPLLLQDVTLVGGSFEVIPAAGCAVVEPGASAPLASTHLVMSSVPDAVTAGRLIDPAITVTLMDDDGAVLTDSSAEVTISLRSENGAQLLGTATVRAVAGIAAFADLAIDKAGSGYSFAAEALGAATSSSPVTVNPGSPARLHFVAAPLSATPGVIFATQPIVEVEDVMGNVIENATDPIVLAITEHTGPSGARLACDNLSVVPTGGVATFGSCRINIAGTDISLTATTASGLDGQSDRFPVIGPATKLAIVQEPSPAVAGETLSAIAVAVEDSAGNVVTDSDATVTLTVNQHSESMTGTTSVAVVDGVASFTDLAIATSASNYTLTMKATGLRSATSAVFDVATAAAAQLVFTRQPSGGKAGKPWSTQPIVTVHDAYGNVVVTSVDAITLQLSPGVGTPGAVLACAENPLAATNGEVRFSKCTVDLPGSGYTVTATSGALSAVSAPFSIA